ncbi:hypothetical protein [uncultured Tenacibaculum sp.]|uniref:hypothetical protein n=1 Tax=uncultured Tenacibaculum sp. TaxID=174713 RepID=UPI0026018D8E|nr:hypothetical protein [uncultured Tenacibaculum sp.]
MKNILIVIAYTYLVLAFSSCAKKQKSYWIDFYWKSSKIGEKVYDKSAMFVDFTLGDKPKFSFQLDTGSPTFFKDSIINSYLKYYKKYKNKLGVYDQNRSLNQKNINNRRISYLLNDLPLNFKDTTLVSSEVILYPNSGKELDSLIFANYRNHIGTLGINTFEGKKLVIDYPNKRFIVLSDMLPDYEKVKTIKFELDNSNRILLPVHFNRKKYYVMFDTGSSIFPLITNNRDFWNQYSETPAIDSLQVPSFGNYYTTYKGKIKEDVKIEGLNLKNKNIYLGTRPFEKEFKNGIEIIGVTGNQLFLKDIIMIDFSNKEFNFITKKK